MKHGFIKVAAATPTIRVADCKYNGDRIIEYIDKAKEKKISLLVFPELSITGYTCGDLFLQETLLRRSMEEVKRVALSTLGSDIMVVVGLPINIGEAL